MKIRCRNNGKELKQPKLYKKKRVRMKGSKNLGILTSKSSPFVRDFLPPAGRQG